MSSSPEITLQEVPRCPDNVQRRLQEFDRRLRVVFDIRQRVWQIQEQLKNGSWSHVMFWADGPWNDLRFRQLPFTADPLIAEILKRDITRSGVRDVKQLVRELEERGARERAKMLEDQQRIQRDQLRRYAEWAYRRAEDLVRMFKVGGRSRAAAIRERQDVLRDLGLRRG